MACRTSECRRDCLARGLVDQVPGRSSFDAAQNGPTGDLRYLADQRELCVRDLRPVSRMRAERAVADFALSRHMFGHEEFA